MPHIARMSFCRRSVKEKRLEKNINIAPASVLFCRQARAASKGVKVHAGSSVRQGRGTQHNTWDIENRIMRLAGTNDTNNINDITIR